MGEFFLLCVSLFSKNVYEDHNFYKIKKKNFPRYLYNREKIVSEKMFRS